MAWGKRLSYRSDTQPLAKVAGFGKLQRAWMTWLGERERMLPGINHAARRLPSTLLAGLLGLVRALPVPAGFKIDRQAVILLAQLLVTHMVNARSMLLDSERKARLRRIAVSLAGKLADGPHTVRALTRRTNRLTAAECGEALFLLEAEGVVKRSGDDWQLASPGAVKRLQTLILEV